MRYTGSSRIVEQLEDEYRQLQAEIAEKEEVLASRSRLLEEVKRELVELRDRYGDDRRTEIIHATADIARESLEPHEQVVVTLSQSGYIKRVPSGTFRKQHRGGKGVGGMAARDDDAILNFLVVDTHDRLVFFTGKGRVYSITAYELRPDTSRASRGVPLSNVLPITDTETISAVVHLTASHLDAEDLYITLATRKGRISADALAQIRPSGINFLKILPGDDLVSVGPASSDVDIAIITRQGMAIRFPASESRPMGRGAQGVRGIKLADDDEVVGMDVGGPDSHLMAVSELGRGKVTALGKYRVTSRGGKGVKTMAVSKRAGQVAAAQIVDADADVYVISERAQVLKTNLSEIRSMGRATQGVTIFRLADGDVVASLCCVSEEMAEESEE